MEPVKVRASGIYKITFKNGHFYYGQTQNFTARITKHKSQFKNNNNSNSRLQYLFNKYGMPDFEIVEYCELSELDRIEQIYLDKYFNCIECCNMLSNSNNNRGFKLSDEAKLKISKNWIGRKHSKESKEKMKIFHSKKRLSNTHKANISLSQKGIPKKGFEVLNLETGIYYLSIKEASISAGIYEKSLKRRILNKNYKFILI